MEFDKPEHRQFVLEMMEQVSFPGKILDLAAEFKRAVVAASVKDEENMKKGAM